MLMFEPEQVILSGGGKKEDITKTCQEIRRITNEKREKFNQYGLQDRLNEDLSTPIKPFSNIWDKTKNDNPFKHNLNYQWLQYNNRFDY